MGLDLLDAVRNSLNEIMRHVKMDSGLDDNPNYIEEYTAGSVAIHELETELTNIANLTKGGES